MDTIATPVARLRCYASVSVYRWRGERKNGDVMEYVDTSDTTLAVAGR
jgi:hypothetical protein